MNILAIETSCDETAVAVLKTSKGSFTILGESLYSQASKHAEYGGVYPNLAKREHQENLPRIFEAAYTQAGTPALDMVVVTAGPGLEPALWQGIEFAKKIALEHGIPVYGVDHMEGHIVSGLVKKNEHTYTLNTVKFPILALLISGGHTELVLMRDWFQYELIGRTRDDAVGEAYDKVARIMGLPYPGGPEIDRAARASRERGIPNPHTLPRPMLHEPSCDFSFSGLKTAVLYKVRDHGNLSEEDRGHIAQAFEDAVRDVVGAKVRRALLETGAKTLAVGGGVSANNYIRSGLQALVDAEFPDTTLNYPDRSLSGDNAIMIGIAAALRHEHGMLKEKPLSANGSQHLA